ncbi:UNVERIFIED_CONTAM: hypothetical protein Scaly_2037300 [Sesamum calycinum]|uniref:Reverse transcriptase zinc-binding domain-containing protein n=1 Tax=Sesamum calycinum TaxID=2727403 RepID=A0AAW2N0W2_9LAMI
MVMGHTKATPTTVCREIEGMMADFIWHNKETRRVHWLSWDKLCMKKEEGGLGFRKLGAFNLAMLVKQAVAGLGCSFTWRSILSARDLLSARMWWHIRTNQNVQIWTDKVDASTLVFQGLSLGSLELWAILISYDGILRSKVRFFAWGACRDSLPTSSNLVRRGVSKDGVVYSFDLWTQELVNELATCTMRRCRTGPGVSSLMLKFGGVRD